MTKNIFLGSFMVGTVIALFFAGSQFGQMQQHLKELQIRTEAIDKYVQHVQATLEQQEIVKVQVQPVVQQKTLTKGEQPKPKTAFRPIEY